MSYYRLMHNDMISEQKLITGLQASCALGIESGRHYLCIQDTSAMSYRHRKDKIKPGTLGWIANDPKDLGFFLHPTLVVDAEQGVSKGFSHIHVWSRNQAALKREDRDYKNQPIEEKESWRWVESIRQSEQVLKQAGRLTFVQDREGDIYELFAQANERVDFIVRSRDNRRLANEEMKLFEYLNEQPSAGIYTLNVRADVRQNRRGRQAQLDVRWVQVELAIPQRLRRQVQQAQQVWAIRVEEIEQSVPKGEKPLQWYLLTSHSVESLADVFQIVQWYAQRWWIETLFRILKKEGLDLESNEMEDGQALIRMCLLSLPAALQIMATWLVYKQAEEQIPLSAVFDPSQITCLQLLGSQMQGKTQKQQNPYPPQSLRWASWVLARLGGWSGLQSQRPPGVVTFIRGYRRFEAVYLGFSIYDMYKP